MRVTDSFWAGQLGGSWQSLGRLSLWQRVVAWYGNSTGMLWRHQSATASPLVGSGIAESEKLAVIVLNHKRPDNVAKVAQYTLRAGFVGKLIISNNSQEYSIRKFVNIDDPRLTLIDQPRPSGVGISFELAQQFQSRFYVRIDDDIFLHPAQLQWIYWNLRLSSARPHGVFGAKLVATDAGNAEWPFVHQRNADTSVDILNGLFAFTREHLSEYLRLCELLGISDQKTFMNGEDIVLSFAGDAKPLIHNVGPIWECASASTPGVALHQSRPGFYAERMRIFRDVAKLKSLSA